MMQHYFWLVTFVFMVIEGIQMYFSLVKIFDSHVSKYMQKYNIAAWGMIYFNIIIPSSSFVFQDLVLGRNSYYLCFIKIYN